MSVGGISVGGIALAGEPSGGGGLPTATDAGQVPLSSGAGTTYAAVDFGQQVGASLAGNPSGARAAIGAAAVAAPVTYDFTSATGLTPYTGINGPVTITGGAATLTTLDPTWAGGSSRNGATPLSGPAVLQTFTTPVPAFDVAARMVSVTPASSSVRPALEVAVVGAAVRWRISRASDNGFMRIESEGGAVANLSAVWATLTGEEWVRCQLLGGVMTFFTGLGVAGALPTAWTSQYSFVPATALWESVALGLHMAGSVGVDAVAVWGDLVVLVPDVVTL